MRERHAVCRAVFTTCVRCDRGQRYCSPECRSEVRQRQRHDANRRYQQSEPGRQSHRRCQKRYRERALPPAMAEHTPAVCKLAAKPPWPRQWIGRSRSPAVGRRRRTEPTIRTILPYRALLVGLAASR